LLIAVTVVMNVAPMDMFVSSATAGTLLISVIYILIGILAFRILDRGAPVWNYLVLPVAIITPVLAIYGSVVPFPPAGSPPAVGVWLTIAAIVAALVWTTGNLGNLARVPALEEA
jgi:hypothetical protein